MENQLITQTIDDTFKNIVPTHALVTNIQMKNGKQTAITTLFCCADFSFEEINISVRNALDRQYWLPIDKAQAVLYRLKGGKAEETIRFFEEQYNRYIMATISKIQHENLALIQELGDYADGFRIYAKSVQELFFLYIQNCLHHNESVVIDGYDVYKIQEVINFLENLQYEKNKQTTVQQS